MKKITLKEATNDELKNAILNNPEHFGFHIPQTREELVEAAMDNQWWQGEYRDYKNTEPEPLSFREWVEFSPDIDNNELRVFVREYDGYIVVECEMTALAGSEECSFSPDFEIEVEED